MPSESITYTQHDLPKKIIVNSRIIIQIFISSHCHKHYQEGISERLIVNLVEKLDWGEFDPDGQEEKKEYFEVFPVWEDKSYKLIWWWWLDDSPTIWVRTCHRSKKKLV